MNIFIEYLPFGIGLFAGFIGTISGGSALFTIPALITLGVPPINAIATTKISSLGTFIVGGITFFSKGIGNLKQGLSLSLFSGLGALCGVFWLVSFTPQYFEIFLNIAIVFLLLFNLRTKKIPLFLNHVYKKTVLKISFFFIGIWGAIFPGQGALATMSLVSLGNSDYLHAAATRKITGFIISIVSIGVFGVYGFADWYLGLMLFMGTSIGSFFGSLAAIKKGNTYVKYLFFFMIILMVLKNLFNYISTSL
jgi:uncharacterized protein